MIKVLLAGINSRFSHSSLALYSLRTYAADPGHDIKIIEFTINQEMSYILREINREEPNVLGLSVYIWNVEMVKLLIPEIRKELKSCTIVLGGPEVSYDPAWWIENITGIDFIIKGPGEAGFRNLLLNRGLVTGPVIETENPHFSKIPFPYIDSDFPGLVNKNIYYEAGRGCPFKCTYCLSSRLDQKLEFRELDQVKMELDIIISHRPRIIKFVDRTFNARKSFYRPVWEHIVDRHSMSGARFHFEIYPGLLNDDDFIFLAKCPAGLFQFEVGIQTTSPRSLAAVNRNSDWQDIKQAVIRLTAMKNIPVHVDLIAGLPFEDRASLKDSFNEIHSLKAGHFQLGILKVLKGTGMYDDAGTYGIRYSGRAPYAVISNRWLSEGEMGRIKVIAKLVDMLYNSLTFARTLEILEGHFESGFDMYDNLAEFIMERYPGSRSNSWEDKAAGILEFAGHLFPLERDFFLDALTWDWCGYTKLNYFPRILAGDGNKNIRKTGRKYFYSFMDMRIINYNGIEFSEHELKRSLFMMPASARFRREFMDNRGMALFLPDKRVILFDP